MTPDPYTQTQACVDRLLDTYEKFPRLIVAFDFDDTVFDYHHQGHTYDRVLHLLRRSQERDFYLVAFTASAPERYNAIREHMERLGIRVDSINENPVPLPFGNHGKVYYNILLDDRAGLGQASDILDQVLSMIEAGINGY